MREDEGAGRGECSKEGEESVRVAEARENEAMGGERLRGLSYY